MSTRRTDHPRIRDERSGAAIASCWTLQTAEHRRSAAEAALVAMPASPGLLRFSIYSGIEDLTLFLLSQWSDGAARDAYLAASDEPRAVTDAAVPDIRRDWRHPARPYRSHTSRDRADAGCLVVVRQPLQHPDDGVARDWSDTAITALESDDGAMAGLCTANFYLTADHGHVLNLAEWMSADAHRSALQGASTGEHGGFSGSPQWVATRSHTGITAQHDVRRYRFFGAVEPAPAAR